MMILAADLWGWHTLGLIPAILFVIAVLAMMTMEEGALVTLGIVATVVLVLAGIVWFAEGFL